MNKMGTKASQGGTSMGDLKHGVANGGRGLLAGSRLALDVLVHYGPSLPWEDALRTIARYTAAMLETLGASVLVTEGGSDRDSLAARARAIQEHGAEVLVCLRAGKHPSTNIRGLRALTPGLYLPKNRRLAELLLIHVEERTGLPSRGTPLWPWFPPDAEALMRPGRPVCVVFECGCLTCPADEVLMSRRAFRLRCAYGLAEGLLRYFGVPEGDPIPIPALAEGLDLDASGDAEPMDEAAEPVVEAGDGESRVGSDGGDAGAEPVGRGGDAAAEEAVAGGEASVSEGRESCSESQEAGGEGKASPGGGEEAGTAGGEPASESREPGSEADESGSEAEESGSDAEESGSTGSESGSGVKEPAAAAEAAAVGTGKEGPEAGDVDLEEAAEEEPVAKVKAAEEKPPEPRPKASGSRPLRQPVWNPKPVPVRRHSQPQSPPPLILPTHMRQGQQGATRRGMGPFGLQPPWAPGVPGAGLDGQQPEPMIRRPDGSWISPKAYAILKAQERMYIEAHERAREAQRGSSPEEKA